MIEKFGSITFFSDKKRKPRIRVENFHFNGYSRIDENKEFNDWMQQGNELMIKVWKRNGFWRRTLAKILYFLFNYTK